jgi:drug/metabolite transporter (DMT)-like permease
MLLLASFCWGISIPVMKALGVEQNALAPHIGSMSGSAASLAVRFGGAVMMISLFARVSPLAIRPIEWMNGGVLGIITAVSMWMQVDGLHYTSASVSGFLIAMYCVFIPIFSWVGGRRGMTPLLILCCLLVIVGMAALTGIDPRSFHLGRGEWESLGAAVLFACQILWVSGIKPGSCEPARLTWALCAAVALCCAASLALLPGGFGALAATHSSVRAGLLTAVLSVFGTALPFLLMNLFQSKVGPITAGFIYCFEPIAAAVGALFLPELLVRAGGSYLNESFSMRLTLGGALILAANLLLLRDKGEPSRPPA